MQNIMFLAYWLGKITSTLTQLYKVNVVQYSSLQQLGGKKKTKNKPKKNNNPTEMKKHKHNHLLLRNIRSIN